MPISLVELQNILEAAIMVAGHPVSKAEMLKLFDETDQPEAADMQTAIHALQEKYQQSGVELRELASGFQFQAKTEYSPWLVRLWEDRPARYSRAFLETLALIAYRQPVTRAEIEEIRGVTVSSNIIKTLLEREWIKVLGYKEVPGKPALYGTTKTFLDNFNLKSLDQLPSLAEIKDLESQEAKLQVQLELTNTLTESTEAQLATASSEESIEALVESTDTVEVAEAAQALEESEEIELTDELETTEDAELSEEFEETETVEEHEATETINSTEQHTDESITTTEPSEKTPEEHYE